MLQYKPWQLRHPEDIPESDETPVDSEDQNWIPNLLLAVLLLIWRDRFNWFFAVDMLILPRSGEGIVPDAFLSLGVPRRPHEDRGRLSYILRNENDIPPIWVLEMVSQTYREEYTTKKDQYARLGVLYYVIYNPAGHGPKQRESDPLEVYRLESGRYRRVPGDPVWMPEIGLGIGCGTTESGGVEIPCLYWFDEQGNPYPFPEELIAQERLKAEQERLRAEQESARAEQESARAEQESARAEQESARVEQERIRAEREQHKAKQIQRRFDRLAQILRAQGLDPDEILGSDDPD